MRNRFHVGDAVMVPVGRGKAAGVIVEDRGPIGIGGRHFYQVEVARDPFDPITVELPEEEFEAISAANEPKSLTSEEIVDYLKAGGLIAILRSNLGGKNQPKVWLCRDSLGNVTHTFIKERGLIGGEAVPVFTAPQGHIPQHKQVSVEEYLQNSFGLRKEDAQEILNSVGVAT